MKKKTNTLKELLKLNDRLERLEHLQNQNTREIASIAMDVKAIDKRFAQKKVFFVH